MGSQQVTVPGLRLGQQVDPEGQQATALCPLQQVVPPVQHATADPSVEVHTFVVAQQDLLIQVLPAQQSLVVRHPEAPPVTVQQVPFWQACPAPQHVPEQQAFPPQQWPEQQSLGAPQQFWPHVCA
jgi:hypothetical protein